jgi:ABC-type dipeptide/oligopeptide/nickel transport system permease component
VVTGVFSATRAHSLLDAVYIRTARAKGLRERRVVYSHGLRSR